MIAIRIMQLNKGDTVVCLNCGEHFKINSNTLTVVGQAEYIICPNCHSKKDIQEYRLHGTKIVRE